MASQLKPARSTSVSVDITLATLDLVTAIMVYPSEAVLATYCMATIPSAPVLFSTTEVASVCLVAAPVNLREVISIKLPGLV